MRAPGEVDCEFCEHYGTRWCEKCIHNEDLDDYYVPASKNILENKLIDEKIEIDLPVEFLKVFAAAKKFSSYDNMRYIPVHAGENYLAASDGYALAHLNCNIPSPLKGKNIVRIENGVAMIHSKMLSWQDKKIEELVSTERSV